MFFDVELVLRKLIHTIMKNQTLNILIALCFISIMVSCSKDDNENPSPSSSKAFSVNANGTDYSTDTANFDVESNSIQIYAAKFSYTNTVIINIASISTGTHTFANNTNASFTKKTGPGLFDYDTYRSTKGSVVLSSVDTANKITGTFQFTAYNVSDQTDSVVFTNGTFTLNRE